MYIGLSLVFASHLYLSWVLMKANHLVLAIGALLTPLYAETIALCATVSMNCGTVGCGPLLDWRRMLMWSLILCAGSFVVGIFVSLRYFAQVFYDEPGGDQ